MDALNYRFNKYISEAKAAALVRELEQWKVRADQYLHEEKQRVDNLSIAQRVLERRNK